MRLNPFRKRKDLPAADANSFTSDLISGAREKQVESQPADVKSAPATGASPTYKFEPQKPRTIACIVTHGMGQQGPFETVGALGEAFAAGKVPDRVHVNRARLTENGGLLSRLELVYEDAVKGAVHLHIYEGYWAPLTEGKVTFYESIRFLLSGAIAGIRTCLSNKAGGDASFSRWMFGKMVDLPVKPGTLVDLLIVLSILGFGLLLGVAIEARLEHVWQFLRGSHHLLPDLKLWPLPEHPIYAFYRTIALVLRWLSKLIFRHIPAGLLLLAGAVYVYFLHYFLVEYVGDVAIYVSSHKVSKFEEVRTAIQKTVFSVGRQVYEARTKLREGPRLYDEVIIVGHSLGSVISYDLLNELIVWDRMGCDGSHDVVGRTTSLITFGSPLDKTAFLFRTQVSPDHHYREALAGIEQPLILDYRLRPPSFKWTNIYSSADIVSGRLVYYDLPDPSPTSKGSVSVDPLENKVVNKAASGLFPILAHIQYWSKPDLRKILQEALWRNQDPDCD
jgi:hypothetical protein